MYIYLLEGPVNDAFYSTRRNAKSISEFPDFPVCSFWMGSIGIFMLISITHSHNIHNKLLSTEA